MGFPTLKREIFVEKGREIIHKILSADVELVAFDIMKKELLSIRPKDKTMKKIYYNWMKRIALSSKYKSIRLLAIEEMYKGNDVVGLKTIISETKHNKDRRVCINLILESCKEHILASPLNALAHRIGIGTGGIRVVEKDWVKELPSIVRLIKDYELRKETAEKINIVLKRAGFVP